MISTQTQDLLRQLRRGEFDPSQAGQLDRLSPEELVADLRDFYPVVFQERRIGNKSEIGMARTISLETEARQVSGSSLVRFRVVHSINRCVLVSSYGSSLSELTVMSGIRVRPIGGPALSLVVKMGHGYKLDKTPDGWSVKRLKGRGVTLSESFLLARGWRFDMFGVFSGKN